MGPADPSPTEILDRLVSFDTTSHKTNIPLINYVKHYLSEHDIASDLVPDESGAKASLFATIGPAEMPGIGLSGHTDVVPVTGQEWATDPFCLTAKDGKLYGRGSADMKGFLACVLAAAPKFRQRNLKTPIHIVFSYDEEVGCTGVRPMIEEFGDRLTRPRLVVVGEPTSMSVVDAHKGPVRFAVEVTGLPAHSSLAHLGVNSIHVAGQLIGELLRMEAELKAGPLDDRFTPNYATLQIGLINGGTAGNIVPGHCRFSWEVRAMPGQDVESLENRLRTFAEQNCLPAMHAVDPNASIDIARKNAVPPFTAGASSDAVSLAFQLAEQNETFAVSYGTEAGLFQVAGSASVICGPGDIAQAHGADEFVEIAQLDKCMVFMDRLADWAS